MNTEWMADALCREIGGDFWHPEKGQLDIIQIAKRVCNMCPVKQHVRDRGKRAARHLGWGDSDR